MSPCVFQYLDRYHFAASVFGFDDLTAFEAFQFPKKKPPFCVGGNNRRQPRKTDGEIFKLSIDNPQISMDDP